MVQRPKSQALFSSYRFLFALSYYTFSRTVENEAFSFVSLKKASAEVWYTHVATIGLNFLALCCN